MQALVTGAHGFVGRWLTTYLRDLGDTVVGIDHDVEITDAAAVRRAVLEAAPQVIYHLAALTHVGQSWQDPGAVLRVNALGTLHVLEAARACDPVPRVLLTSSAEVYGAPARLPVTESDPLLPVTPYAASKVAAEYLGIQAHAAYGTPVVRVRPFNHIGPGQSADFVVSALAKRIAEAQRSGAGAVAVGNLDARRDLTDVRDVVRAYRLLVVDGEPGSVYNVCSGRDLAIRDLAEHLVKIAGTSLELVPDPALVRPLDVAVVRGDCGRLAQSTGWEPQIDLETTLADVLAFWRSALG